MCIYTVSPLKRGRQLGRRPEHCTQRRERRRDPLHVSGAALSRHELDVHALTKIPSIPP